MGQSSGITVDKKVVAVLVLVLLALVGSFALIYLDLRANITALKSDIADVKNENANLSSSLEQLRNLFEELHANQTISQPAVLIYNETKSSVVLVTTDLDEGSGFVYDSIGNEGHIVTNNHVVQGAATITVTFVDGTTETAQANPAHDVYSDLALLKVGKLPNGVEPLKDRIRNSTTLVVGEPVYAIGNPFGLSSSMTSGIVSQLGRVLRLSDLGVPPPEGDYSIADVIQFDAAINPGNSGGVLLDSFGNIIGVTFAIETGNTGVRGFIGIGYAVPSILLLRVIPDLESKGYYEHPYVGIIYDPSYTDGVHIIAVNSSTPAEQAGLQAGDVIKQVNNVTVTRGDDFIIYLERYKSPGDTIDLEILRNGLLLDKNLTLGVRQGGS